MTSSGKATQSALDFIIVHLWFHISHEQWRNTSTLHNDDIWNHPTTKKTTPCNNLSLACCWQNAQDTLFTFANCYPMRYICSLDRARYKLASLSGIDSKMTHCLQISPYCQPCDKGYVCLSVYLCLSFCLFAWGGVKKSERWALKAVHAHSLASLAMWLGLNQSEVSGHCGDPHSV